MSRIYIDRRKIKRNHDTGDRDPPIVIHSKGQRYNASSVAIEGYATIVYKPDGPPGSEGGQRVWIQCDEPACRVVLKDPTKPG